MKDLKVRLEPGYPVRLRESFRELWQAFQEDQPDRRLFLVVDARLLRANPSALAGLPARRRREPYLIDGGERCKSLRAFARLQDAALKARLDRQTLVVAVGGGTVGDLAGFFAATHLRGLPWCCVATTSLAMADSAVGGKTAVNRGTIKNAVGAFHQPLGVYGCVEALRTLPARYRRAGLAEVVKSAMIADARLFCSLERDAAAFAEAASTAWLPALNAACAVKARIVAEDERESGRRALLNFGHTAGHAFESQLRPRPLHGEAVSLGMVVAARLSEDAGLAGRDCLPRLRALLGALSLPHILAGLDFEGFWEAVGHDKKRRGGAVEAVLTHGIGSASFGHPVGRAAMRKALRALDPLEANS